MVKITTTGITGDAWVVAMLEKIDVDPGIVSPACRGCAAGQTTRGVRNYRGGLQVA